MEKAGNKLGGIGACTAPGERTGMNKRLLKRHKRQVSRAKERVRISEPDLRTPEQVSAAREVSRSVAGRHNVTSEPYSTPPIRSHADAAADTPKKADAGS